MASQTTKHALDSALIFLFDGYLTEDVKNEELQYWLPYKSKAYYRAWFVNLFDWKYLCNNVLPEMPICVS